MKRRMKVVAAAAAGLTVLGAFAAAGAAGPSIDLTSVPFANAKVAGRSAPNLVSPELQDVAWAQGSNPVENPSNSVVAYGYLGTGTFLPVPSSFVSPTPGPASVTIGQAAPVEAQKTEPDKNTYLVLDDQKGADPNYDYGRHFLFQGHEAGTPGLHHPDQPRRRRSAPGDADGDEGRDAAGPTRRQPADDRRLDLGSVGRSGCCSRPRAPRPNGGVWQGTLDVPSSVDDLRAWLGRGGYEGIQNDDRGNLYIVEDVRRHDEPGNSARRPNSFVYRFLPKDPSDLKQGGKIQALQVIGRRHADHVRTGHGGRRRDIDRTRRSTSRCTRTGRRFRRSGSRSRRRPRRRRCRGRT